MKRVTYYLQEWSFVLLGSIILILFISAMVNNGRSTSPATQLSPDTYFLEENGFVVMEAEHYTDILTGTGVAISSTWQVSTSYTGHTGDGAMVSVPNADINTQLTTEGPALFYRIYFQTPGTYYAYVRGQAESLPVRGANDSIHVGLDGVPLTTLSGNGLHNFGANQFNWRHRANGNADVTFQIPTAGFYTFNLWMREDGMVVDKIWLTTTADAISYGDTDTGPDESPIGNTQTPIPPTSTIPLPTNTPTATLSATHTPTPVSAPNGVYLEQNGEVVFEAEGYTTLQAGTGVASSHTWQPTTAFAGHTGSHAMQALPNINANTGLVADGPAMLYDIQFNSTGTYYVYVRGLSVDNRWDNDSVHVGLNGVAVTSSMGGNSLNNFTIPEFNWRFKANNIPVSIEVTTPGVHTFYLWMREDGVIIDKIWLSTTADAISYGNRGEGPPISPTINPAPTATPTPSTQPTWQQLTTSNAPDVSGEYSMAYDANRGVTILYGGNNGFPYSNQTWQFDGSDWQQLAPSNSPTARYSTAMAFANNQLILFGGNEQTDTAQAETWQFDGTDWQQLTPTNSPPARAQHQMVSHNGLIYLFGGNNGATYYNDLWTFDGTDWQQLTPSNSPSARTLHGLVSTAEGLLLFGGRDSNGSLLGDTWLYANGDWSLITDSGPSARQAMGMAYDFANAQVILQGGIANELILDDFWVYQTGSGWAQRSHSAPNGAYHTVITHNNRIFTLIAGESWLYE